MTPSTSYKSASVDEEPDFDDSYEQKSCFDLDGNWVGKNSLLERMPGCAAARARLASDEDNSTLSYCSGDSVLKLIVRSKALRGFRKLAKYADVDSEISISPDDIGGTNFYDLKRAFYILETGTDRMHPFSLEKLNAAKTAALFLDPSDSDGITGLFSNKIVDNNFRSAVRRSALNYMWTNPNSILGSILGPRFKFMM